MVKKSVFTRILFRSHRKPDHDKTPDPPETGLAIEHTPNLASSASASALSSSSSSSSNSSCNDKQPRDQQGIDRILWASPKQQHLFSLLKCSNSATCFLFEDTKESLNPQQQSSIYSLRLYLATVQKLKRQQQPTSMEKRRAIYHILSNLVVQQELDRFEPAFEPIGRRPRKTRYISALLDTPAEDILLYRHPVVVATQRKPFVETYDVILPSSTSSSISLTSASSVATFRTFPPYKRTSSRQHPSSSSSSSHPTTLPSAAPILQSSCSDPSFHSMSSGSIYLNCYYKTNPPNSSTTNEDEDNIPLAILKNKKK